MCQAGIIGPSGFSPRASWPGPFMRAVSPSPTHHWWQRNAGEKPGAVSECRVPTPRRATWEARMPHLLMRNRGSESQGESEG